jgi:predicted nucleic acid-binding protein
MKPLIVIDLDVVTVNLWKGSQAQEAEKFIEKVENRHFDVIVPYTLIELAKKWQYIELKEKVIMFYKKNATEINAADVEKKLKSFRINDKEFVINLVAHGIKEEDVALVMITSLFKADYLVTFNRKHLRNKEREICEVLNNFNLPKIKIRTPQELLKEVQNEN